VTPQRAPYPCPECGGVLEVDTCERGQTIAPAFLVCRNGEAPRLEQRRRPAVVALCTACEYVLEINFRL
jgi:hypothetical protein